MESLILEAINHVRNVSKKKVNEESILQTIKRKNATIIDKDSLQVEIDQMLIKGLLDANFKILNNNSLNTIDIPSQDDVHFTYDQSTVENQNVSLPFVGTQDTPKSDLKENTNNSILFIGNQATPIIKPKSDSLKSHKHQEFDDINAKVMALKNFFMDEIYTLRQDISSLQKQYHQDIISIKNDKQCSKDFNDIIKDLKAKLKSVENENSVLKEEIKNKKRIIDTVLDQNAELLKLNSSYVGHNVERNIVYNNKEHIEKEEKTLNRQKLLKNTFNDSEQTDVDSIKEKKDKDLSKSLKDNITEKRKNKSIPKEKKSVFVVGDSMIKNITGSGISRNHSVKIRSHPGATTMDMFDYIKPELRQNPDRIILHCGTNDLTNDVNTTKKIKKLIKEIKENFTSTELVISGIIQRYDQNFNEDIERINEKLRKLCVSKGLTFIDNKNINEGCLNRGKLHLNRRGSSYLANNFKKYVESL